jgi:hypothetical protein
VRLVGRDEAAGETDLAGRGGPDQPGQQPGRAEVTGGQADAYEGGVELGVLGGQPDVGGQCE